MGAIGKLNTQLEVLMNGNKNNLVLALLFAVLHIVLFVIFNVIGVASVSYFLKYKHGKPMFQKIGLLIA
jgi:hypothetical protein